jgi:hypothetical protein
MIDLKVLEQKFEDFFKQESLESFRLWLENKKRKERRKTINPYDLSEVAKLRRKHGSL